MTALARACEALDGNDVVFAIALGVLLVATGVSDRLLRRGAG